MMSAASQKHGPYIADFSQGNTQKITAAMSGEYGGCSSVVTLFFAKQILDQHIPVHCSIFMKEKPAVGSPFLGAFPSDCIPKATKDVNVHFSVHSSNTCKLYQQILGPF